jgi:hypothetical protein
MATGASATMRISDDVGGRIGAYVDQYSDVRNSGERVVIDGACLSACTLVLGIEPVPSAVGTQALWDLYPQNVRKWINSRGGLSSKMMFLRGSELMAMYPQCSSDDWVR